MRTQAGRLIFSAAAIITLAVAAPRARAQGNGLQPSDYQRLRAAGQAEFSPDGKLLARNSAVDSYDKEGVGKERATRRTEVLKRIKDTREGKGTE